MAQAESALSTNLPSIASAVPASYASEYRRLAYRMFRTEGVRCRGGRLYRLAAVKAWQFARKYPLSLAGRYAEALQ